MYKEFYGFRIAPFNITPDPNFLFYSPTHEEALKHLHYGIREKKGFIVLTGEVGCGKTTVCRKLLQELDPDHYETALILNPRLSEAELIKAILTELRVEPVSDSRMELVHQLNELLLRLIDEGKDIVVIIDESQNLDFETIEHLRMLSNLETDTQKLLQIILMGQPELKEKLKQKRLRQLRQRILVYCDIRPLTLEEMKIYILYRLNLAGANGRPRFTPRAMKKIYRISGGVPRIINNLCDKALLAAYIRNRDDVNWWDVRRAHKEMEL
ncbi:MAG: AAA family ATPase [Opitutales bacterium]|nr:AAA family ATPase [Opitutales bacterium]